MNPQFSTKEIFKIFWLKILKDYKLKLGACFALILFASVAELLTLSAIFPFLSVLSNPDLIFNDSRAAWLISALDINSPEGLILPFALFFCFAAVSGALIRLASNFLSIRLAFSISHKLSISIFHNALHRTYAKHVSANNNEVIATLGNKLDRVIFSLILQVFLLLTALIISLIILIALIYINPILTLSIAIACGTFYLVVILLINTLLLRESEVIAAANTKQIKTMRESLGGIRDVLINNAHNFYYSTFETADYQLRRGQAINMFASMSPRFLIEGLGLIIIVVAAYYYSQQSSFIAAIPILGALAVGAQKLLPLFQQLYVAWTSLRGNYESLQDVVRLLNESPHLNQTPVPHILTFRNSIQLKELSFQHSGASDYVFHDLNFSIVPGDRIGIIGKTGAGKSTLVDIIAGLLFPTKGQVSVDGVKLDQNNASSWMTSLAYVPQNIFLSDESILENIAIGEDKKNIDKVLVRSALKHASLDEFILSLPEGVDTKVGERGIKISGGQKQRIGIARAIYKKASLIIFDEATSALDAITETSVMDAIYRLDSNITMLVIAHRTSTLKNCNKIIKLENNAISILTPEDLPTES